MSAKEGDEGIFEVEAILDKRVYRNKVQYSIKWLGYNESTWENETNCNGCQELITEFEQQRAEAMRKIIILKERVLTSIFGLTDTGNRGLVFLVKFEDNDQNELLGWIEARQHFAKQVMDFFRGRLCWAKSENDEIMTSDEDSDYY